MPRILRYSSQNLRPPDDWVCGVVAPWYTLQTLTGRGQNLQGGAQVCLLGLTNGIVHDIRGNHGSFPFTLFCQHMGCKQTFTVNQLSCTYDNIQMKQILKPAYMSTAKYALQ